MKKILLIIGICVLAFFACKKDIELLHETVPTVLTDGCEDVTASSAKLYGELKSTGVGVGSGLGIGFYYSTEHTPTSSDKYIIAKYKYGEELFTATLTELSENTTYYVRAYARNKVGEVLGETVSFTTLSKKMPTMGSTSVTNVTANSATVIGNVISAGTGTIKERGFCLSTTKTPSIADSCIAIGSEIGSFNYTLTGLEDGVTFYVRAYATSEVGTVYGESMSFTTTSALLPVVTTLSISNVATNSATLNGNLESKGTSAITAKGFCYSTTTQTPTLNDRCVNISDFEIGSFSFSLAYITEGTTYYVRAYATNGKGTAYGETVSFTTKSLPKIGKVNISDITTNSASLSCNVTSEGSASVTERGFYYSTSYFSTPTFSENKISVGQGAGRFLCDLNSLNEGTTYYVCAYATNSYGTEYGPTVSFTTKNATPPTVETISVENISNTTATINGSVTTDGGVNVTERGICWNTTQNPTISKYKKVSGSGIGNFSVSVSGLKEGTTYYARAYATNSKGTAYGEQISFETNNYANAANIIEGAIQAVFSVSDTKKVYFSQGNLQYQASTNTWRFAEHQYDWIVDANKNISSTYSGWIDLFGWGTSGWNSGANAYQPYSTSTDYSNYYLGGDYSNNLTDNYANADWGVYNKISNGGNAAGMWRTLTNSEWNYVISNRTDAASKTGVATVNGVTGLILLPDNWTLPDGLTFTSGANGNYARNTYSISEWSKMEANGAVFLPAAGLRIGASVYSEGSEGNYWSSSASSDYNASCLNFSSFGVHVGNYYRSSGHSVRLVKDVK